MPSQSVAFEVAGTVFEVAPSNLRPNYFPRSKLNLALDARDVDDDRPISISGNPHLFTYILDLHRQYGFVEIPPTVSKDALMQEGLALGLSMSRELIVEEGDTFRQKMGVGRSIVAEDYFQAWTVDQVADWLQGVQQGRFAKYVPRLREQGVDGLALATLVPETLKILGVIEPKTRAALFASIRHEAECRSVTEAAQGQGGTSLAPAEEEEGAEEGNGETEKRRDAAALMLGALFGDGGTSEPFTAGIAQWRSEQGAAISGQEVAASRGDAAEVSEKEAACTTGILVAARLRPVLAGGPDGPAVSLGDFEAVTAMLGTGRGIVVHECGLQRDGKTPKIEHRSFRTHEVIDPTRDEKRVFDIAAPLIDVAVKDSLHSTILCYGQTGSGKTHTVGNLSWRISRHLFSAHSAKLVVFEAFELKGGAKGLLKHDCHVISLHTDCKPELALLEGADGAVRVGGSNAVVAGEGQPLNVSHCMLASSPEMLEQFFREAAGRRASSDTERNAASSRSHAFYRFYIAEATRSDSTVLELPEVLGNGTCVELVDLAGSESNKDCLYHNKLQIKERANINASLQALNSCIQKSAQGASYVPFRADKLTQLLRPCFAKRDTASRVPTVLFIACLSPLASDAQQSIRTMTYTQELAGFKPKATRNAQQMKFREPYVKRLVAAVRTGEIEELRAAIAAAQRAGVTGPERRRAAEAVRMLDARESE
ncbi:unnamed protein product [Prorocentrum cordatum]|uniref:Kinesin-like protein n=1 Tax=Prorocentrum cordatum TaxID=2364126 RepID=A0ABN9RRL3_9DINO|nr:unnamed protein product [Polarella glacialis]